MSAELTPEIIDAVNSALGQPDPAPVLLGHEMLREVARPVAEFRTDPWFAPLVDLLAMVMRTHNGVGLAAPQLGIGFRLVTIEDRADIPAHSAAAAERPVLPLTVLIDPRYEIVDPDPIPQYEGCLSFPGWRAVVPRAREVRLHWMSSDGEEKLQSFRGWPARIIQHEVDHLDGVLYIDRADLRTLTSTDELRRRRTQSQTAVPDADSPTTFTTAKEAPMRYTLPTTRFGGKS